MVELDTSRHNTLVDPALHVWGWEIPTYLFLGGVAAGILILGALLAGRPGPRSRAARLLPLAAPVLVSAGMLALFLDLAHKVHVWRFYAAFRWTSPMSWGAWILVAVYPVSILFGLGTLADADVEAVAARSRALGGVVRTLRAAALPRLGGLRRAAVLAGAALGVYTGVLLSALGARALWASALLGPLFLASGLSTGAAFLMLFPVGADERRVLARWDLAAIGVEAAIVLLWLVGLATGSAAGRDAAALLLGGRFTAPFWALVVAAGLAVPAALEALEERLHLRATAAAPALVLAGGLALRWILVAAGQGG